MPIAPTAQYFGSDPEGWNHEDDGKVGIILFSNAVQVWAIRNFEAGNTTTVRTAAQAFCCDDQMIVEAVKYHPWMLLEGPQDDFTKLYIEHEGE